MANAWFRMYAEFSTDPKVQMMSETDQRRYIMVLCLRCNGDVTLHDNEVAFQLRINDEEWARSKALFLSKNLITDDNKPTAWDKRQFVSDSSAPRVAKHRAEKKAVRNGVVTLQVDKSNVVDTDTDTERTIEPTALVASKLPTCPQNEILGLYAELLPELPQPRIWEGARQKNLAARWKWAIADLKAKGKPHATADGLDFFARMFRYVARSEFLTGQPGPWCASLDWLVESANFAKVIAGNYDNKAAA